MSTPGAALALAGAPGGGYAGTLADVLPATLKALGVTRFAQARDLVPAARRAVVVLLDGLGYELLARRGGHAPFLRAQRAATSRLLAGFPTTTATSIASFGTGSLPGAHGLVGYEVLDPATDRVLNELSWEGGPDPIAWQPGATIFEQAAADGLVPTMVGPAYFNGSGLTQAALRGARFSGASSLPGAVDAALSAVRRDRRSLVYLYWGGIDRTGHVHGCGSWQWGDELERVDGELSRLAAGLPADTVLIVTADHGMVDIPHGDRIDLADRADLMAGVRHLAGEPRAPQLHVLPGAESEVLARWRAELGPDALVVPRDQALDEGWFGAVRPGVEARVGDVLVVMRAPRAVVHSQLMRPELLALLGVHGAMTPEEADVPLTVVPPRSVG